MLSRFFSLFSKKVSPAKPTVDNKDFLDQRQNISSMTTSCDGAQLITASDLGKISFWRIDADAKKEGHIKLELDQKKTIELEQNHPSMFSVMQLKKGDVIYATAMFGGGGSVFKIKQSQEKDAKPEKLFDYPSQWHLQGISPDATQLLLTDSWERSNYSHAVYTIDCDPKQNIIALKAPHGLTLIDSKLTSNGNEIIAICADDKHDIGVKVYSIVDGTWDMRGEMAKVKGRRHGYDVTMIYNARIFSLTRDFVVLSIPAMESVGRATYTIFSVWSLESRCLIVQHYHPAFETFLSKPSWIKHVTLPDNPNAFVAASEQKILWLFELDHSGMRMTQIKNFTESPYHFLTTSCFIDNVLLSGQSDQPITEIYVAMKYLQALLLPLLCRDLLPIVLNYVGRQLPGEETIYLDATPAAAAETEQATPTVPRAGR